MPKTSEIITRDGKKIAKVQVEQEFSPELCQKLIATSERRITTANRVIANQQKIIQTETANKAEYQSLLDQLTAEE